MSSRNLRIRAVENGVYDKFHLTRTRFNISTDMMTTDMGSSYLSLRTTLRNGITQEIINTQLDPNGVPVFHCLGDGVTAYDGTSLFRTAKLFNQSTGQIIEELNYNNQRTNTFKEFTTDFDNLASDTIESGLGIPDSKLDNLQSTYTLWTNAKNNTIDLHIPLKSIFPSLNVPFFQLSAVGGLIVDLEWDTSHPLVMSYANPELVIPPPRILDSGIIGFNTTEQEESSWLVREQINSEFAPIEKPFAVQRPSTWEFPRVDVDTAEEDRYWDSLSGSVYGVADEVGIYAGISDYKFAPARVGYTDADLAQLSLIPTSVDADSFTQLIVNLGKDNGDSTQFNFMDSIVGMEAGNTGNLTFALQHQQASNDAGGLGFTTAVFNGLSQPLPPTDVTNNGGVGKFIKRDINEINWGTLVADQKFTFDDDDFEERLLTAGIIKKTKINNVDVYSANQDTTFVLGFQHNSAGIVYMCPDLIAHAGGDYIDTNQYYAVPYGEQPPRINVETYIRVGAVRTLTFSEPLNLDYVENVRLAHRFTTIIDANGQNDDPLLAMTPDTADSVTLFISNVIAEKPLTELLPHYPSCDLAEMVLVQYPPTKTPMPKFYRTIAVEPFNISSGMSEVVQNFMLEPNVYNAWVMMPYISENNDISTQPSLISGDGNVEKFRATIDEVDVVNKDIELGIFPDSLYWDKLADCFSNSSMAMKTLTGSVSGATQRPVRVFPIRIYGGLVDGVVSFSNFMKRLQIRLQAPQGENVQSGTAYLFKEKYKSY